MTRKQCLLSCFLSHKSPWFFQNWKMLIICLQNHFFYMKSKHHVSDTFCKERAQPGDGEVKEEWGDFQVCRRIFLMREYLFTPDGRSSPLPPVSFLPSPHYPKWPFLLLPLREEEQECLGRVRLNLVCLGGIIHFTRHRMGCCLNLAFSFELLREVYGTRHSLKQAKIGLICLLCEVLPLLSAHPSQVVPKSTVNWFTEVWQELMVKPLARHP